jgi:cyclohexadieny/prephenate dehydrogenase
MKMLFSTLTIVGVGLIGGSIGLAAKKRGAARRVVGVGRDPHQLEQARRLGAIDAGTLDLADAAGTADCIIFCAPVDRIAGQIKDAAVYCKAGAILTDAGSTKREIVQAVEADLPGHLGFVGGHPLAGSERKGVEHSHADLFVQRWTVLTPTQKTPKDALACVQSFWQALGSRVRFMAPADHDQALALTSHLPHLVASVLAGILPDDWIDLTASGFRDMTRVASGDPGLWTPIFRHNSEAVLAALDQLEDRLREVRQALANHDVARIDQFLAQGKKVRDALGS